MKYLFKILVGIILLLKFGLYQAIAQDIQFTQYYASGTYLNPAFTGSEGCTKISSINRKQWSSFSGGYTTNVVTFETPITKYHNAIGISLLSDVAGAGKLYSRSIKGLYSYSLPITRKHALVLGIEAAYTFRGADYSSYLFSDQLARGSGDISSIELNTLSNTSYFDFSTGALYYSDKYWVGIAAHHLSQPNQSLVGQESILPIKYSLHGGYKIKLGKFTNKKGMYLSPSFNYKAQAKFDQLDLGLYYNYDFITFGLWYRGLPIVKSYAPGEPNNDAIAIIVGYGKNSFRVAYSYDITISKLTTSTSGSHELTLSYVLCSQKRKRKKKRMVPCAKF